MRIGFFGSSNFSCHVLRAFDAVEHDIAVAISQPDSPAGRGMQLRPTPLAHLAAELGIDTLKPKRLRPNAELLGTLRELRLDGICVASYGKIIPPALLSLTPWPLNVHPSPLPLLRGASPLRSALLQGWQRTEVCIMRMTPQIDDGPVMLRQPLAIDAAWNYAQLERAAGELGGKLLNVGLRQIAIGRAELVEQEHGAATYCQTFTRADTVIDWTWPAPRIQSFVRAWDPDLGASTRLNCGGVLKTIKLWRTEVSPGPPQAAPVGEVVAADKTSFTVQTGSGQLRILELQPESKPRMSAAQFLTGNRLQAGDRFESHS